METWFITTLNHVVGQSQAGYVALLVLGDEGPWVLSAMIIVSLWFSGSDVEQQGDSPRVSNRKQTLLIILAMLLTVTISRYIGYLIQRPNPFQQLPLLIPVDIIQWLGLFESAASLGAFPGEISSYWFAMALGVGLRHRKAGYGLAGAGVVFVLARMATGLQWPSDILAGAILGCLCMLLVWVVGRPRLKWLVNPTLSFFEWVPMLLYPVALLFLFDAVTRLNGFYGLITRFFGIEVPG